MNKNITIGAFAKLCDTTKATLRWYRQFGLFEPAVIGSNGYAYYSVEQVFEFKMIKTLQNIGFSLDQIKTFKSQPKLACTNSFLEEQISQLDQRMSELQKQRDFLIGLQNTERLILSDWGNTPTKGDWQIKRLEEESYLVMNAPVVNPIVYKQHLTTFQKLCGELGLGIDAPIAMFFEEQSLLHRQFSEGFCLATKVTTSSDIQEKLLMREDTLIEKPRLVVRAAGEYLVYLTAFPLEPQTQDTEENDIVMNLMIAGQNAAFTLALREGFSSKMGLLQVPLVALAQEDGRTYLFSELSFFKLQG